MCVVIFLFSFSLVYYSIAINPLHAFFVIYVNLCLIIISPLIASNDRFYAVDICKILASTWLLQRKSFFFPNDCPRPQTHDDWFPDETFDSQPAFLPAMLPFTVQVTSCILHITFSYVLPSSLYLGVRNPTWNYTEPRWLPRTPWGPRVFTINPSFCTWILLLSYVSAAGETHYASFSFSFSFFKGVGAGLL